MANYYASLEDAAKVVSQTEWLWKGWLPRGHVSLLVGAPGEGKSGLSLAIADILLRGYPWPDGQLSAQIDKVMWLDTEGTQAVLVERAQAAGIPLDRIIFPSAEPLAEFALDEARAVGHLRNALAESRSGLMVVDTLRGAHSAEENSSKDTARIMKGLQIVSRDTKIGCLVVHHTRKLPEDAVGDLTIDRVRGSNAIVANARVVWGIEGTKHEGLRRLVVIKSNLAAKPDPLGFRIDDDGLSWLRIEHNPAEVRDTDRAILFLRSRLANGPMLADYLKEAAVGDGHSLSTLYRAKKKLGARSVREHGTANGRWYWEMP